MIPSLRHAWPHAALLLISIACAGPLGADPLLARAQLQVAAGDSQSAARLYRSWLELNWDAPGSAPVFSRYFRLERDVPALLASSARFLSAAGSAAGAGEQLVLVARLFELAGRVEDARDAYLRAFEVTGSRTSLLSSALLSLEMNDIEALTKVRTSLAGGDDGLDGLLGPLVSLSSGDGASGRSALLAFAAGAGDRDLSLKALWMAYSSATAAGDQQMAAEARRRLDSGFPGGTETALASRGGAPDKGRAVVVALPRPDLSAPGPVTEAPAAPAPSAPAAPPPAAPAGPVTEAPAAQVTPASDSSPPAAQASAAVSMAVQAGAFQVKENADYLVTDLIKKGFHPSVREDSIQGVVHYRVFAGTGMAADQAKDLLSRLIQAGFSGFLVADK